MSGFDREKADAAFFAGTSIRSNFLCNIGYDDPSKLFPRSTRSPPRKSQPSPDAPAGVDSPR